MDYQTFRVEPDFQIKIEDTPGSSILSDQQRALVDMIWEEEKRLKGDKLFNGRMLCYSRHDTRSLHGHFVNYKEYIAVLRNPLLRAVLPMETLGASGITIADGAVLMGKRASFVTEYPGYYECAPSGGLNPEMAVDGVISPVAPFEQELHEETGIVREMIESVKLTGIVYDVKAHLYEIIGLIKLHDRAREVALLPTEEYDELLWVEAAALPSFLRDHKEQILPMSYYLLTNSALPA